MNFCIRESRYADPKFLGRCGRREIYGSQEPEKVAMKLRDDVAAGAIHWSVLPATRAGGHVQPPVAVG